jgi:hypothetical protein
MLCGVQETGIFNVHGYRQRPSRTSRDLDRGVSH